MLCVPTMTSTAVRAPQELRPFLLRDAAGRRRRPAATPVFDASMPDFAEPREQLLFGALAHAAGVDHDDVGIARRRSVGS